MKSATSLLVALVLTGCITTGPDRGPTDPTDPGDPGAPTDPGDPPPPPSLTLGDRYDVVSIWDLSSTVENQALGAAARQLVVELAVDTLGVPSFVRDEAIAEVDDLVGAAIEDKVSELAASSQALADFRDDLGEAEITSEWTLDGAAGRERLIAMAVETNGVAFEASLDGLDPLAELGGPLAITGENADRAVETYELAFGAGALIRPAAENAVAAAVASFDCDAIALAVVGPDGELEVGISFATYTITAADVAGVCADQIDSLAADLLAMLDYEIGIELGGPIALSDDDGDAIADRIDSTAGYAGTLLGLPLPVAISLAGMLR